MFTARFILFFFFFSSSSLFLFSQSIENINKSIEDIQKKQDKTKKEINYLNTLLKNAQNNQSETLEKLAIIDEKINRGKELVSSLTEEIDLLEYSIRDNEKEQSTLNSSRRKTLDLYSKLVYETWKKKNHQMDKIAFILSSADFSQAYARYRYFEQIQDYSKQQLRLLEKTNNALRVTKSQLVDLLSQKSDAQLRLSQQNEQLAVEMKQANNMVEQLKKKQQEINKKLSIETKNEENYRKEREKLIRKQIEISKNSVSAKKNSVESKHISDDFVKQKGRLPWPVVDGFVSEKYGNSYSLISSLKNVESKNAGVTITTSGRAEVRAVFDGVVEVAMTHAGRNIIVIIRHGERFWTIYDNLVEMYVKGGDVVKSKQKIGRLPLSKSGNSSLNFQIWNNKYTHENPALWLSK
jgi:septal ring factor EnvC (AmiA/AmiB activator)